MTDPVLNDPSDPLIGILIYNYDSCYLRQCLESIFQQQVLKNFEVILNDDATSDGTWDTALQFLERYSNRITVIRNRRALGTLSNLRRCMQITKGRYCVPMNHSQAFLPEYIQSTVAQLNSDPYAKSSMVCRVGDIDELAPHDAAPYEPLPNLLSTPLVSILCYNYNYGVYLRQCLESIFSQTYQNIELCFSDNASTDDSWSIALEFARKYPDRMNLVRNRVNFGPHANFSNCYRMMTGKYFDNFCSDDVLDPEYVARCVSALEGYPNAGLAIVNRAVIDENGRRADEAPFYNQSCIIPGEEQAAVYMMAGVNPSVSQIMYRKAVVDARSAAGGLVARYYGTRILDFNIAVDFDVAYLKEALLLHRIHSQSDTSQADTDLLPIIGMYVLNHQFADIAAVRGLTKVTDRLPQSLDKLATLAVRYSVRSLMTGEGEAALRYFHLAVAIRPGITDDPSWQELQRYWSADDKLRAELLDRMKNSVNLVARSVSYDPPAGSIPLLFEGTCQAGPAHD